MPCEALGPVIVPAHKTTHLGHLTWPAAGSHRLALHTGWRRRRARSASPGREPAPSCSDDSRSGRRGRTGEGAGCASIRSIRSRCKVHQPLHQIDEERRLLGRRHHDRNRRFEGVGDHVREPTGGFPRNRHQRKRVVRGKMPAVVSRLQVIVADRGPCASLVVWLVD